MPTEPTETVHLTPLEIWYMYKTKILTYAAIIAAVLVIIGSYQLYSYLRITGSESLYAKAESTADFQAVMQKYPGTVAAGNAALRLADKLRSEQKYDEAVTVLRAYLEKYPGHPLAAGGWISLAQTYEIQGKMDSAMEAYTSAISKYPEAFTAPIAMMGQARINLLKGKKEEARRIYQDVAARYQQSIYARQALSEAKFIKK